MGVFLAVGGVCRLISISGAILCIGTVHLQRDEDSSSCLAVVFILHHFGSLDSNNEKNHIAWKLTFHLWPALSPPVRPKGEQKRKKARRTRAQETWVVLRLVAEGKWFLCIRECSFLCSLQQQLPIASPSSFFDPISFCFILLLHMSAHWE